LFLSKGRALALPAWKDLPPYVRAVILSMLLQAKVTKAAQPNATHTTLTRRKRRGDAR